MQQRLGKNRFTKLARTGATIVDQNFDPVSNVDSPKCLSNCSYCRTKFHQCGKGFSKMVISTLHIMCGYQCDKAVNKNYTREVI